MPAMSTTTEDTSNVANQKRYPTETIAFGVPMVTLIKLTIDEVHSYVCYPHLGNGLSPTSW